MQIVLALILLAVVGVAVLPPLLRPQRLGPSENLSQDELEAEKEAKYRELRDTELDHAAGKLSDRDFAKRKADLRNEAAEMLRLSNQSSATKGG